MQLTLGRAILVCLAPLVGASIATSCASSPDPFDATEPASSAERAQARAQREARQKALAEQSSDAAAPAPTAEPEPVPEPPPPEPVVEVPDAGPPVVMADAAPDAAPADAGSGDAGPAPVAGDLCNRICARVVTCAKEIMGTSPGGIFNEMIANIGKECATKCAAEVAKGDKEKLKKAEACLKSADCDSFRDCVRSVVGDDEG